VNVLAPASPARLEWLLSTPEQQKTLRETARQESAAPGAPPLSAARYALFAALSPASAEVPQAMDRLVQTQKLFAGSEPADGSFASFARDSAGSLLQWGRPAAAAELLKRAVDADPVLMLLRTQLEGPQREDLRLRLVAARLLAEPPTQMKSLLETLIKESTLPAEAIQQLGQLFEQVNHLPAAYWCYQLATEQSGLSEGLLTGRMRTARKAPDSQAWIETCELAAKDSGLPNQSQYQLAARSQLAGIAQFERRFGDAEKMLTALNRQSPDNAVLTRQLAEFYLARNQLESAEKLLAASPGADRPELLGLRLRVLLAQKRPAEAVALLEQFPKSTPVLLPALLTAFVQDASLAPWEPELARRATRPEDRLRLLEARLRHQPPDRRAETLQQIEALAATNPELTASVYLLRKQFMRQEGRIGEWIEQLRREWQEGKYFAGELLIQLYLEENRPADLEAILPQFLALDNLTETTLQPLALLLEANERWSAAALVYQKLVDAFPASSSHRLGLAKSLTRAGRSEEAAEPLAALHQARQVLPGALSALAAYHLANEQPEIARSYFLEMKQSANAQEQANGYAGLAECALQLGDRKSAEANLREASALDLAPQLARLAAEWVRPLPEDRRETDLRRLNLTPPTQRAVRQILERSNAALPSSP